MPQQTGRNYKIARTPWDVVLAILVQRPLAQICEARSNVKSAGNLEAARLWLA